MKLTRRGNQYLEYYFDVLVGIVSVITLYFFYHYLEIMFALIYHMLFIIGGLVFVQQVGKYVRKLTGWRRD